MVNVIDYPTNKVKPDLLPEAGDQYEAYGLAHKFTPVTIHFVLPDWSIVGFPYANAGMSCFRPIGDDGDCIVTLVFNGKTAAPSMVVITGRHLHDFYRWFGDRLAHWLWALPESCATVEEDAPVVHSIEIKDADRAALAALLTAR